jgi:PKD repeat protein
MADEDGIVLLHNYTGSIGTSSISRSRTLTHEVGHWLNLDHCWGPTNEPGVAENCAFDDNVSDTPNTIGWTSCSLDGATCGSLDNVQNYMEYSYCSRMFTQGQRTRMRAALNSNTAQRNQLWQNSNLTSTGTLTLDPVICQADFSADKLVTCVGEPVTFFDESFNGISEWSWDFGDGNTATGADPLLHKDPIHTYAAPGVYTVALTAGNGVDNVSVQKTAFIKVLDVNELQAPFAEGFENAFPGEVWFTENPAEDITFEVNSNAAFSGTKSMRIRNYSIAEEGAVDAIITSTYDFSNYESVTISYRWAYANKLNETDDRLRVMISSDCGSYWILKKLHRGLTTLPTAPATNSQFTPNSPDQWAYNEVVIDIPDQLTAGFRVKFEWEARGGNNFYIDDINIGGTEIVSVSEALSPTGSAMKLYPNPASETLNLETTLNTPTIAWIQITDLSGKMVAELPQQSYPAGKVTLDLNVSNLASGMYILNWQSDAGNAAMRFVVE